MVILVVNLRGKMKKPWHIQTQFSEERLDVIAAQIVNARNNVADKREPESGDNPWVHGVRAYGWAGTAIEAAASQHNWLTASMRMNLFDGRIEGLRFSISRDDPSDISERTHKKLQRLDDPQSDFGFEHVWSNDQVRFCFIIDSDADEVFGISCVGVLNSGLIVARHDIDLVQAVTTIIDLSPNTTVEPPDFVPEYEPKFKVPEIADEANENKGENLDNVDTEGKTKH